LQILYVLQQQPLLTKTVPSDYGTSEFVVNKCLLLLRLTLPGVKKKKRQKNTKNQKTKSLTKKKLCVKIGRLRLQETVWMKRS